MISSLHSRAVQLETLLDTALDLEEAERIEFLKTVAPELRAELIELLNADSALGVLDRTSEGLIAAAGDAIEAENPDHGTISTGQRIGHYRLLCLLGEGGMATVWLAERDDGTFSHQVAVKCLKTGLATPESRTRFLREQQILAQLQHPNIARLYDAGISDDGVPFIVMEWVDGKTITRDCDERRLNLKQRLQQFKKICSAVGYAHQNLIVHRDLKPGNILVGSDGEPKLLDFGIAKLLDETSEPMTQTGLHLLTPEYAAPEQFSGAAITTATDVYALGGVLYEMLCGLRPRQMLRGRPVDVTTPITAPSEALRRVSKVQPSDAHIQKQRAEARASGPERLRRALRGDLDTIVMKALQNEPSRRYPTIQTFNDDIDRYLNQQPIQARKEAWTYWMGKFLKRHALGTALTIFTVTTLLTATGISVYQARRAEAEAKHAATETERAQNEAKRALAVKGFLTNLFEVSDSGLPRDQVPTTQALLEDGVKRIQGEFNDTPELKLELLLLLGHVQSNLGLYDSAESLLKEAVTIADANLQPGNEVWLQAQTESSKLLLIRSQFALVIEKLNHAIERYRAKAGKESIHLATALSTIAKAYCTLDRFNECVEVAKEALAIAKRLLGEHDARVQPFLQSLGSSLLQAERWKESEVPLRESVLLSKKLFGERNAKYADSLVKLASSLSMQGQSVEAEASSREALTIYEAIYDRPNAAVVSVLTTLGVTTYRQNKLLESEAFLRRALAMQSKLSGQDNAITAVILSRLATTSWKLGRMVEAEHFYRQTLDLQVKYIGPNSLAVAQAWDGIALTLKGQKRYTEAAAAAHLSLDIMRQIYGDKGRMVGLSLADLAIIHEAQGQFREALLYMEQALQILGPILDSNHPHLVTITVAKGEILNHLKDYRAAKSVLMQSVSKLRGMSLGSPDYLVQGLVALGHSEQGLGEFNEALAHWNEALALARTVSTPYLKESIADLEKLIATTAKKASRSSSIKPSKPSK